MVNIIISILDMRTLRQAEIKLNVQWLRLHASTARGVGFTSGQRNKILQTVQYGQKKKKKIPELNSYLVVGLRFESGKFGSTVHTFNKQHGASPKDVKKRGEQRWRRKISLGVLSQSFHVQD